MIQKEITAQVPEKKDAEGKVTQKAIPATTILVNFPETVDEAIDWCGEESLLSNAFANFRVTLQGNLRNSLKSGLSAEQCQDKLGNAVMGTAVAGTRVDPQAAFIAKFKMATPEEQAEMLAKLREAAEG